MKAKEKHGRSCCDGGGTERKTLPVSVEAGGGVTVVLYIGGVYRSS